jgi:predicted Rossmann fold nucleotide-binding protein DprA/Smf involved in DNA uptake
MAKKTSVKETRITATAKTVDLLDILNVDKSKLTKAFEELSRNEELLKAIPRLIEYHELKLTQYENEQAKRKENTDAKDKVSKVSDETRKLREDILNELSETPITISKLTANYGVATIVISSALEYLVKQGKAVKLPKSVIIETESVDGLKRQSKVNGYTLA